MADPDPYPFQPNVKLNFFFIPEYFSLFKIPIILAAKKLTRRI